MRKTKFNFKSNLWLFSVLVSSICGTEVLAKSKSILITEIDNSFGDPSVLVSQAEIACRRYQAQTNPELIQNSDGIDVGNSTLRHREALSIKVQLTEIIEKLHKYKTFKASFLEQHLTGYLTDFCSNAVNLDQLETATQGRIR